MIKSNIRTTKKGIYMIYLFFCFLVLYKSLIIVCTLSWLYITSATYLSWFANSATTRLIVISIFLSFSHFQYKVNFELF